MSAETLVILAFLSLVASALYVSWRRQEREEARAVGEAAHAPIDPVDEYLDAMEEEAYYRARTILDAEDELRRLRNRRE